MLFEEIHVEAKRCKLERISRISTQQFVNDAACMRSGPSKLVNTRTVLMDVSEDELDIWHTVEADLEKKCLKRTAWQIGEELLDVPAEH